MDLRKVRAELSLGLRRLAVRMGWMGAAGAGLVLLAGAELFGITLPAAKEVAELESQVLRQRESPRSGREIAPRSSGDAAAQVAAFEARFPAAADINRMVGEIHAAAHEEKLVLERGEYRLSEEPGLDLLRYQITLPVKGSYLSIRGFVSRVLRDLPSLSLDGVSLQRQNVGDEVLEAQVRLSLYHRGAR